MRIDIRTLFEHTEEDTGEQEAVTREELLKALADIGIDKKLLQGVEIQGKHTIYVVFNTYRDRNRFLNKTKR